MSNKSCSIFHQARMDLISELIKFIKAGNEDERDIDEEIEEAIYEAKKESNQ